MERTGWIGIVRHQGRTSTYVLCPEGIRNMTEDDLRERLTAAIGTDKRRRAPVRKRKHGHRRHPPYDTSATPPMTPAPSAPGASTTPSMTPAPPELEPVTGTRNLEPSNGNPVSSRAPSAPAPSLNTEDTSAFKTRTRKANAASGVIDENDPEVRRRRDEAKRIRERAMAAQALADDDDREPR